jgi:hypothetical protein
MDVRFVLPIAEDALVVQDAGRLACDRGLPAPFRARVPDCRSASDEEVVADAANQRLHRDAQLAAEIQVAADALVAAHHQAAQNVAGQEFQKVEEVAVARGAALRERFASSGQQDAVRSRQRVAVQSG